MSLSELGTIHDLCELERTQILKSLTSAVLKINYAENLLSANRSNFIDYVTTLALNNFHNPLYLKMKDATNAYLYITKQVHFVNTLSCGIYYGITLSHVDLKKSNEDKYYLPTSYYLHTPSCFNIHTRNRSQPIYRPTIYKHILQITFKITQSNTAISRISL